MGQRITIKILDRKFTLEAESPEKEHDIRVAAENVDRKYLDYLKTFPGKTSDEILSFVALNSFIRIAELGKTIEEMRKGEDDLQARLRSYLGNIEKKL